MTYGHHLIGCGLSKEPSILFLEISMRRIADVTEALSGVRIGKDTVSRLVERPGEAEGLAKEAPRREEGLPLPLLRRHLPEVRWSARVINLTLLARAGVDEEGLRKVWQWR